MEGGFLRPLHSSLRRVRDLELPSSVLFPFLSCHFFGLFVHLQQMFVKYYELVFGELKDRLVSTAGRKAVEQNPPTMRLCRHRLGGEIALAQMYLCAYDT